MFADGGLAVAESNVTSPSTTWARFRDFAENRFRQSVSVTRPKRESHCGGIDPGIAAGQGWAPPRELRRSGLGAARGRRAKRDRIPVEQSAAQCVSSDEGGNLAVGAETTQAPAAGSGYESLVREALRAFGRSAFRQFDHHRCSRRGRRRCVRIGLLRLSDDVTQSCVSRYSSTGEIAVESGSALLRPTSSLPVTMDVRWHRTEGAKP